MGGFQSTSWALQCPSPAVNDLEVLPEARRACRLSAAVRRRQQWPPAHQPVWSGARRPSSWSFRRRDLAALQRSAQGRFPLRRRSTALLPKTNEQHTPRTRSKISMGRPRLDVSELVPTPSASPETTSSNPFVVAHSIADSATDAAKVTQLQKVYQAVYQRVYHAGRCSS